MIAGRFFHITTTAEVEAARAAGEYRSAAFDREGFIHCSYEHQVVATANRIFHGRAGLVLLEIDVAGLTCPVAVENLEGGAELYPHIYGAIPMTSVRSIHPFPPEADGTFSLPVALTAS